MILEQYFMNKISSVSTKIRKYSLQNKTKIWNAKVRDSLRDWKTDKMSDLSSFKR